MATVTRTAAAKPKTSGIDDRAGGVAVLMALAAWSLFVFAGRDRWAVAVLGALALIAAATYRPRFRHAHRFVDTALAASLAYAALQLVPLPSDLRLLVSPASQAVDRALALVPADPAHLPAHPLTLDAVSTSWALVLAFSIALTFWTARTLFERGGHLRASLRGIVWIGLVLAAVTFVQRSLSPHLFYGIWKPVARTDRPSPLGPFLNRNDLATWLALAVPLVAGYMMARIKSHAPERRGSATIEAVLDSRMMIAGASLLLMMALLLSTASRSGIVGCGAGLLALLFIERRRVSGGQFAALLAALAAIGAVATVYVNMPGLTARFGDVFAPDLGRGRIDIWRQTWPIARDFWRTGVGVGAFQRAMIVYEKRPFELFINHAHNEYLQLLVEGGVPLAALAFVTAVAGATEARGRLRGDRTSIASIRAGAIGGMIALAVESIWDTGILMPANAVLFAIVAAIALHINPHDGGASDARAHDRHA